MLKPKTNPMDIVAQLPAIYGTAENPLWCLAWNPSLMQWTAFDCHDPEHLVEIASDPNWLAICICSPNLVTRAINHDKIHLICESLHAYATLTRHNAQNMDLDNFFPDPEITDITPDLTVN